MVDGDGVQLLVPVAVAAAVHVPLTVPDVEPVLVLEAVPVTVDVQLLVELTVGVEIVEPLTVAVLLLLEVSVTGVHEVVGEPVGVAVTVSLCV